MESKTLYTVVIPSEDQCESFDSEKQANKFVKSAEKAGHTVHGPYPVHLNPDEANAGELLNLLRDMKDFLKEAHQEEIDNDHYGDDSCSYCDKIKEAEELIDAIEGEN